MYYKSGLFTLLTSALLSGTVLAQVPTAGTVLTNQAQISGQQKEGPFTSLSNQVRSVVLPVCGVSITLRSAASVNVLPTETAVLSYEVTNTGNQTMSYPLLVLGRSTAISTRIIPDANGNGQADDTDAEVLTLAAGESRTVFVSIQGQSSGEALLNLATTCGAGSAEIRSPVAYITVGQLPEFGLSKTFDREVLRPGEQTTVTVTLENRSGSTSRELWLSDDLSAQVAGGLSLVPDSVKTSGGRAEYSTDGITWQGIPTAPVRALRVYQDQLAVGERLTLTFQMQASDAADGQKFVNVARLSSLGSNGKTAQDTIRVAYRPAVRVGPPGQPEADGEADQQRRALALTTRPGDLCFDHTVKNTGDVSDTFHVQVNVSMGQAVPSMPEPFTLAPGVSRTVQVCYTGAAAGSLQAEVLVQGERGSRDTTQDIIERIETSLPELQKTVRRPDRALESNERVRSGEELVYELRVRNPYAVPLEGVTITDELPQGVELLEAAGAEQRGGRLSWAIGTLAAGAEQTFTVRVRVTTVRDDQAVSNIFSLVSTAFPEGLSSNAATFYTWNSDPTITKVARPSEVTIGDRVTYTVTVRNTSVSGTLQDVQLFDNYGRGLEYIADSSRLNGEVFTNPSSDANRMVWTLPDIAPGQSAALSYDMLVTPDTGATLRNEAQVLARGAAGAVDLASNQSSTLTQVRLLNLASLADILGTVFTDSNGNGVQDSGESGVAGARVLLAGGRQTVTDAQGRYHFGNVPLGTHAVRLDPASVHLESTTPGLTQTLWVRGLTTAHFALPASQVRIGRALPFDLNGAGGRGWLTLWPIEGGYQAQVVLTPTRSGILTVSAPLPQGAKVLQGSPIWSGPVKVDEPLRLNYSYRFAGPAERALLLPTLEWKE